MERYEDFLSKYEKVVGRKLEEFEINRIEKYKKIFGIKDEDALWTIILIFDYFAKICQDSPAKIESILKEFSKNNLGNELIYSVDKDDNKIKIVYLFCFIVSAIFFTFLGYNLANYNFEVLKLSAKLILTGSSFLLTLFFATKYIKYALNSDKKWIINIFYSALSLASTLFFFVIL